VAGKRLLSAQLSSVANFIQHETVASERLAFYKLLEYPKYPLNFTAIPQQNSPKK